MVQIRKIKEVFAHETQIASSGKSSRKKIGWAVNFLFLSVAVTKDLLDVLKTISIFIPFVGLVFWIIFWIYGLFVNMVIFMFLRFQRIPFNSKHMAQMGFMFIGEAIPIVGIFPITTITLMTVVKAENKRRSKGK